MSFPRKYKRSPGRDRSGSGRGDQGEAGDAQHQEERARPPAVVRKRAEFPLGGQQIHKADGEISHHAGKDHAQQILGQERQIHAPLLDHVHRLQNGGSEHGGQGHEEGKAHSELPVQAAGHSGGDGAPRPGQAGQGGHSLGHADEQGVLQRGAPGVLMAVGHPVGQEEDHTGEKQDAADRRGVVADLLHIVLDGQYQKQGQGGHDDQQDQPPGRRRLPLTAIPGYEQGAKPQEKFSDHLPYIAPVIDEHGDQGGEVEQDVEQVIRLRHSKKVLEQGQVPGTGNGQKFSDALDDPQDGGHQI